MLCAQRKAFPPSAHVIVLLLAVRLVIGFGLIVVLIIELERGAHLVPLLADHFFILSALLLGSRLPVGTGQLPSL